MRGIRLILTLQMVLATPLCAATLSFDPAPIPGGSRLETLLLEAEYSISGSFGHGSSLNTRRASNNSSGYLEMLIGSRVFIERVDGSPFNAVSVDLSEYSLNFVYPASITFIGNVEGDGVVSHTFITDGIFDSIGGLEDFETMLFPSSFQNLRSLFSNTPVFSFDNLTVEVIPEPSDTFLLMIGFISVLIYRHHRFSELRGCVEQKGVAY